jgi:hypothetical protein
MLKLNEVFRISNTIEWRQNCGWGYHLSYWFEDALATIQVNRPYHIDLMWKECYDIIGKLDSVIPERTNRSCPICMAPICHNRAASGENSFLGFSLQGAC